MDQNYKGILSIPSTDLPEIKDWTVGDSYDLIVSVKQTGIRQMPNGEIMGTFEVQKVMSADGNDPMDLADINGITDNSEFLRQSADYRARNGK